MTLCTHTQGDGRDIVLIHGWGLHSGIFDDLAHDLKTRYRVTRVDLPGHGCSHGVDFPTDPARLVADLTAAVPADAHWLGWSLGGMAALQHAVDHPGSLRSLILVTATPRFVADTDWPGMDSQTLASFAAGLSSDYLGTLNRFLALQVHGVANRTTLLRRLTDQLLRCPTPSPAVLAAGLSMLAETDLRPRLARVTAPTLLLYGERDRIVPAAAGNATAHYLRGSRLHCFPRAGHAPFLSHADEFVSVLDAWLDEH